jgi:hypothetical protein
METSNHNTNIETARRIFILYLLLAECPQCYYDEIREMRTFHINLYCPKAYHRCDHSIHIIGKNYHSQSQHLHRNSNPGQFSGFNIYSCILLAETHHFVIGSVILSCLVSELQKPFLPGLEHKRYFRNYDLRPAFSGWKQLWSCRRSSIVLRLRATKTTLTRDSNSGYFRSFDLSEISSCFKA